MNQIAHWSPGRLHHAAPGGGTRADLLYDLVQRFADWAADLEGQPRRRVPRLDSDLSLPDQLRVVATDLVAAKPTAEIRDIAVAAVAATRQAMHAG